MNKYLVKRCVMVWEEATVEAADEEHAVEEAYVHGFQAVDRDTRDIQVELQ